MSSINLLKQARFFEKLAAFNFPKVCQSYKNAIQQELNAGIASLNKIFTSDPKSGNKPSLQSLDDAFGNLGEIISKLSPETASTSIDKMLALVGQASFYTSSQNSGTGYDPQTRSGGPASPAGSLQRIQTYLDKLKKYSDYNNSLTKPEDSATVPHQVGPGGGKANPNWVAKSEPRNEGEISEKPGTTISTG